jgi:hypothetical protein
MIGPIDPLVAVVLESRRGDIRETRWLSRVLGLQIATSLVAGAT